MFRFEEPTYLYLLLLLPFLAAFYLYSNYRRRKAIRKFGDPVLMAQLMPDVSKYRPDVKFWLVFAAIGLFAVLLARPAVWLQTGDSEASRGRGNDCVGYF